jgi:hypothetical protein
MTHSTLAGRHFSVHCSNAGASGGEFRTEAASFEEAALWFAERWSGEEDACRVIVADIESGERHCFTIEMDRAVVEAC